MASISTPDSSPISDANKNCNSISKSRFLKTVCLSDWWLLKAENDSQGGGLSVSGFTSREGRAMRVFSSAPIRKSHDIFTLETTDGIFVLIKGLINKARTLENGFPSDVFNHFVFGFPPYWKEYAEKCMGGQSYVESNERSNELQHKMDTERNFGKTKSSTVVLPSKCDGVIGSFEDFSIAPVNFERTFSSGNYANGDHVAADRSVNCSIKKASKTSWFGEHAIISPDGGILSAWHLTNENGGIKGRAIPRSCSKLQRKDENNQISNPISGCYRTRSKSALSACEKGKIESVNFEPRDRNNLHYGIGFEDPMQMSETPHQGKDCISTETKGSMNQAIDKGTRSHDGYGGADNEKEHAVANKSSISEDNASAFSIAPVNFKRTFSSGNCANGDHMTAEMSVNCSIKKASTTSWFWGHAIISPDGGILSACHLTNENAKGRETPESCSKLQTKHENNQISNPISGGYRTRSKSPLSACENVILESVNFDPRDRNNLHCGGVGFKEPVQMLETPNQAKDWRLAEPKGNNDQAIDKGTKSQDWHGAADNGKEHPVTNESSVSKKDDMSKMKTRRKLAYGTPGSEEGYLSGSSKSLSFSRSRSGRLLMPTLKFWRNERALFNAEGNITGIEEEIVPEHPVKGKDGRPQRKRRHLT